MSILLLIGGLLSIMIIKNISAQKVRYIDQLKAELKQESFRGEWERQKLLEILVLLWEREKPEPTFP